MRHAHAPGAAAVCRVGDRPLDDVLAGRPRLLVLLTNVRDPGNAGTVIRGADAAGADAVLVSDASVDVHRPRWCGPRPGRCSTCRWSPGCPVEDTVARLRDAGIRVLAADGAGTDAAARRRPPAPRTPGCWATRPGAWRRGPRRCATTVVRVPIHGRAESLNLAMAATVCLYASAVRARARDR